MLAQSLFDGVADGFKLRRACTRAEQKPLRERAELAKIEHRHALRLLILGRLERPANFGTKGFQCHRYKACP